MEQKVNRVPPRGLGDALKEIFDKTGATVVFKEMQSILNIEDCGCSSRQDKLNEMFPFKEK